jgi:hypothetical protein
LEFAFPFIFISYEFDVMDWIDVAQDRGQWRAVVNRVMNLLVP